MTANYNTDVNLWTNHAHKKLRVVDGHLVIAGTTDTVARFNDSAHAVRTLVAAGYTYTESDKMLTAP